MVVVKQALLSCSDKTGLEEFARGLVQLGVRLIASGGTAASLHKHGLPVHTVEAFAGISQQLDGRVKTLHPKIHAGILAKRDDPAHLAAAGSDGLIDLVVVNLYPFEDTIVKPDIALEDAIEHIDIGGVALLRAAAKNFRFVAAVSSPGQYADVLASLRRDGSRLSEDASRALAAEAFRLTSGYDQLIATFLQKPFATIANLPDVLTAKALKRQPLRYGENPHQQAGWYVAQPQPDGGLAGLVQRHGKELSYNNLLDLDAAVRCLRDLPPKTCVIVKHGAPCGIATAKTTEEAYERAHEGDPESAFGGVAAINWTLDAHAASLMSPRFLEVVAATEFEPEAQALLSKKANVRLIQLPAKLIGQARLTSPSIEWRSIAGGWLVQEADISRDKTDSMRVVTARKPTDAELRDLLFAWLAVKHAKSNAIVVASAEATVGIGQGSPSRVRAVRHALEHAGDKANGAVLASDGFFPFPDSIELAAKAGIRAIIQPGGSVRDAEVIAAADSDGIAMLMTGVRHFRH